MAARMSDRSTQRKEDYLEWLCAQFCVNSRAYVSAAKAALRSQTRENAAEIFETAIDILSQDFPDPTSIDGQLKEEKDGDGNELNSLKDRMDQVEKQLQEAQNNHSFSESRTKKNIQRLDAEIGSLKNKVETQASETEGSIKELTVISKENSTNIQGLRKLQNLLKQKNQAAVAPATPLSTSAISGPATAVSTSAISGPATTVSPSAMSGPPTAASTSAISGSPTAVIRGRGFRSLPLTLMLDSLSMNSSTPKTHLSQPKLIPVVTSQPWDCLAMLGLPSSGVYVENVEPFHPTRNHKITRVHQSSDVFCKSVPQIEDPCGGAITSDGSILVTDRHNKTLHLVLSQWIWIKQL
ncbi:structural maintenance of chromosomes protein 2 [Plakobranchus ocellatus]|uniref:Structural maintenance of chromosomes protein 2 n=1 Tax=Plakobranchus ocellatus TaxID=259542 RepID=A0AAV4C175_9GAST|nr:structural maintenance of chromosomes protein 2 [Plakobranchus ocellatus]